MPQNGQCNITLTWLGLGSWSRFSGLLHTGGCPNNLGMRHPPGRSGKVIRGTDGKVMWRVSTLPNQAKAKSRHRPGAPARTRTVIKHARLVANTS